MMSEEMMSQLKPEACGRANQAKQGGENVFEQMKM